MREKTKDNKGITLIALIITVLIMVILVSVTAYSGIDSVKQAKITKFVSQMKLIQEKVDEVVENNQTEGLGSNVTDSNQISIINTAYTQNNEITQNTISKYKYFSKDALRTQLNIEDIDDEILINFETREVVSINGIKYNGKKYYTQYKLPNGQTIINGNESLRKLEFTVELSLIDGLNSTITISDINITNGTLSFSEIDSENNAKSWETITNYTEQGKTYSINISKTGNYIFKVQDNASNENYKSETIQVTLTNKPKTNLEINAYNYALNSDNWAYATHTDGLTYVWIPRFVYKTNQETGKLEVEFIKGNSNIATDNTYVTISSEEWILPDKFLASDGTELTGIWVNPAEQTGLDKSKADMLILLNSDAEMLAEININE